MRCSQKKKRIRGRFLRFRLPNSSFAANMVFSESQCSVLSAQCRKNHGGKRIVLNRHRADSLSRGVCLLLLCCVCCVLQSCGCVLQCVDVCNVRCVLHMELIWREDQRPRGLVAKAPASHFWRMCPHTGIAPQAFSVNFSLLSIL